ncbi:hypothetical protein [uncultured Cohaesibacter sp.]|uniref:hypothetical protein n=1 Tax=uncultured Cohaesibacter sp. TaxID=1002546 RepID=UPI00292DA764|nr:hypothetical protein [uncultured Cohaesibacter sp.]
MRRVVAFVFCAFLAGCVTDSREAIQSLPDVKHAQVGPLSYRIFENAETKTITTTPPLDHALKAGLMNGLSLGMANVLPKQDEHQKAARVYLDQTGRAHCSISGGRKIVDARYSFSYDCAGAPAKDPSTAAK